MPSIARRVLLAVATLLIWHGWLAAADSPEDAFTELFGNDVKKLASGGPGMNDAPALAARMLDMAGTAKDDVRFQSLLYEKAYEYGMKNSGGYQTAIDAMTAYAAAQPAKKSECIDKIVATYQKWFKDAKGDEKTTVAEAYLGYLMTAGDDMATAGNWAEAAKVYKQAGPVAEQSQSGRKGEVQRKMAMASARQGATVKLEQLKTKLLGNPKDLTTARALVSLCVVDLDNPAKAVEFLEAAQDATYRAMVPLAIKAPADLSETECTDVAKWYKDLAASAGGSTAKIDMLRRSAGYYQQFLSVHTKGDIAGVMAKAGYKQVCDELAKLDDTFKPDGGGGTAGGGSAADTGGNAKPSGAADYKPSQKVLDYVKERDALPPDKQLDSLMDKLKDFSGGREILAGTQTKASSDGILELDLRGAANLVSIEPLYGLKITRLQLNGCENLLSLNGVQNLPLTELSINRCIGLKGDLSALKNMKLTKLELQGCEGLTSLNGIAGMPLTELVLDNCKNLQDISALKGIKLTSLSLIGCASLTSLNGIAGMPLAELQCTGCKSLTGDLTMLKGMKLTRLLLKDCTGITSLNGLAGVPLTELDLTNCKALTGDLTILKGAKVTTLTLSGSGLTSLNGILSLPLTDLAMRNCKRIPVSEIQSLVNIRTLMSLDTGNPKLDTDIMDAIKKKG